MRFIKGITVLAGLSWLVRLDWRLRLQHAQVVGLERSIEHKISEHRDHSPHGIALIGSPPPVEFEPPSFDSNRWTPQRITERFFGLPVYDPQHIISTTMSSGT